MGLGQARLGCGLLLEQSSVDRDLHGVAGAAHHRLPPCVCRLCSITTCRIKLIPMLNTFTLLHAASPEAACSQRVAINQHRGPGIAPALDWLSSQPLSTPHAVPAQTSKTCNVHSIAATRPHA